MCGAFAIKDDKTYIKSHSYIENFEKWLANHFLFGEEGAPCIDNGCTGDSFISLKDFFICFIQMMMLKCECNIFKLFQLIRCPFNKAMHGFNCSSELCARDTKGKTNCLLSGKSGCQLLCIFCYLLTQEDSLSCCSPF